MRRHLPLVILILAFGVLSVWLAKRPSVRYQGSVQTAVVRTPQPDGPAPTPGAAVEASTIRGSAPGPAALMLRVAFRLPSDVSVEQLQVRVGLAEAPTTATIPSWRDELNGGPTSRPIELSATVREWITAPAVMENGVVTVTIDPLPKANVVRVMAWLPDMLFYAARGVPSKMANEKGVVNFGLLDPQYPSGLRLSFINAPETESHLLVLFGRVQSPQLDEALEQNIISLQEFAQPALRRSFEEGQRETVPLVMASTFLPLFPEEEAVLQFHTLSGTEGAFIKQRVAAGKITDVTVDVATLFQPLDFESVDIHGQLLDLDTQRPLVGFTVAPLNANVMEPELTNSGGEFNFTDLSRANVTAFEVLAPRLPEGELATYPLVTQFAFDPGMYSGKDTAEVIWTLPRQRWIRAANVPARLGVNGLMIAEDPYPVLLLERKDGDQWVEEPMQDYLPEGQNSILSVARDGTFRIASWLTPYYAHYSGEAAVSVDAREMPTADFPPLAMPNLRLRRLQVTKADGSPFAGAELILSPLNGALPTISAKVDVKGFVLLGPVPEGKFRMELAAGAVFESHELTVSGATDVLKLQEGNPETKR